MKSILEKALVHLLNEESEKAQELMHQFVVERARSINESLRESDDADFDATDAALEEEFFTESDLDDAEAADQLEDDLDGGDAAVAGDFGGEVEGDVAADADMTADADAEVAADDAVDADAEVSADEGALSAKIDNIESEIASLQAEFDKIMAEFDGGDEASADDAAMGDEEVTVADNDTVADADDAEFDDITESMVDDLKKVSVPNEDGKGANGEKLGRPDVDSPIAKDAKNRVLASKNTVGHTGWERETAPSKKDGPDRGRKYDNNRVKATSGNSSVSATGPKGAELNKPVQSANTKSVIPGGKVTKK